MPILTQVCFAIAALGVIGAHVFGYRAGLMVFRIDTREVWKAARADPYRAAQLRKATLCFIGGMLVGILGLFPMMIQDSMANSPCRQACKEAGWSDGRLRPSPHLSLEERKQDPAACWCVRDKEWSAEPMPIDEAKDH